jgi:hypothetical protein
MSVTLDNLYAKYQQEKQQLAQTIKLIEETYAKEKQRLAPIKKLLKEITIEKNLNKNSCSQVFRINAKPSKTDHDHMAHIVGYCSTMELAKEKIGCGSSYDEEDNCTWFYSIEVCDIVNLNEHAILYMDQLPLDFPYTGL